MAEICASLSFVICGVVCLFEYLEMYNVLCMNCVMCLSAGKKIRNYVAQRIQETEDEHKKMEI